MAWNLSKLTDKTKGEMYKALASKSYAEVAVDFKIDIHYSSAAGYRNAIYRVKNEVEANPDRFGITQEVVDIVKTSAEERKSSGQNAMSTPDETGLVDFSNISDVTIATRNKVGELIHKKLDLLNNNKKALEKVNLVQLTTAFGTLFDKARILQGEATENIAIKARVTKDMSPDEALDQLLNMREQRQADYYEK